MKRGFLEVDEAGRLRVPAELTERIGLRPGDRLSYEQAGAGMLIRQPVHRLRRVYLEPSTACNLSCKTCMRHTWQEPGGVMRRDTFAQVAQSLGEFDPRPEVFIGGYGEPLTHPRLGSMVAELKSAGSRVSLITNGHLLDEPTLDALIRAGLEWLWVSLDGAKPASYSDVRTGGEFQAVVERLEGLQAWKFRNGTAFPRLGLAFVAMKCNIQDFPDFLRLANRVGAKKLSVSNVLAHTDELWQEALYQRSLWDIGSPLEVALPRLDASGALLDSLGGVPSWQRNHLLAGPGWEPRANSCPFVERGSASVRWDGRVSPCLPLLHGHRHRLEDRMRMSRPYFAGSILESSLAEIWNSTEYVALRERLATFDFAPCTTCTSCELADENVEDCFGNTLPACGGCLWAQGFIRCP